MHACTTCMFCHYRNLRIAAFSEREREPGGPEPVVEPVPQLPAPTAARPVPPSADRTDRTLCVT